MKQEIAGLDSVMNLAEALGNLDGDAELLQEIVTLFMQTGPEQLAALAAGIAANDASNVAIKAHGMKGGASNFCARKFVASALQLELAAKSGALDDAGALLDAMKANFGELDELVRVINWDEVAHSWRG